MGCPEELVSPLIRLESVGAAITDADVNRSVGNRNKSVMRRINDVLYCNER